MKKRLKNLLALCMVAMMMFAMSTGVVSAETYYAHMLDGGVYQYILDKNHGNDSVLYKGIPNNVTIAMNPGDIIVPFELTGGDIKSGGKHDDFCGASFFLVTSVNKSDEIKTGLPSKYIADEEKWSNLDKVYQYDADSPLNKNKVTYQLNTEETVDIKALNGYDTKKGVHVQKWGKVEKALDIIAFENAYVFGDGIIQDPAKPKIAGDLVEKDNILANGFGYKKIGDYTYCDALELRECSSGYHYNVKKIVATNWDKTYGDEVLDSTTGKPLINPDTKKVEINVNNVPTGKKLLELASNEGSYDYSALVDTIFTYSYNSDNTYEYGSQCNTGLMITEAPNTYTINFKPGDGGKGDMGLEKVAGNRNTTGKLTYSAGYQLPENKFTKTGYTFDCWKITEATYPDTIYQYDKYKDKMDQDTGKKSEKLIKDDLRTIKIDITKAPYQDSYTDKDEYTPGNHNETVTMTAQWTANTYTVKFDANGGEGEVDIQSFTYDEKQSLNENEFTRTGYTFTGWNTKADGTGTSYSDKAEVQNLTEKANGEVILYAQWDKAAATATGDDTNTMLPIALLMLSSMGIACIALNRKKHAK